MDRDILFYTAKVVCLSFFPNILTFCLTDLYLFKFAFPSNSILVLPQLIPLVFSSIFQFFLKFYNSFFKKISIKFFLFALFYAILPYSVHKSYLIKLISIIFQLLDSKVLGLSSNVYKTSEQQQIHNRFPEYTQAPRMHVWKYIAQKLLFVYMNKMNLEYSDHNFPVCVWAILIWQEINWNWQEEASYCSEWIKIKNIDSEKQNISLWCGMQGKSLHIQTSQWAFFSKAAEVIPLVFFIVGLRKGTQQSTGQELENGPHEDSETVKTEGSWPLLLQLVLDQTKNHM